MTVTVEDRNRNNIYAKEPPMVPVDPDYRPMVAWDSVGETLNGRIAMLGVIAALGSYALTGQIIPGVW